MKLDLRRISELMGTAGLSAILSMGYIVLTGRLVGPVEYSDFSAALSLIYFFAVTTSPLTPTVGRMIARLNARGDVARIAALRNVLIRRTVLYCGLAAGAGLAVSPAVAHWLRFRSPVPVALALIASLLCAIVSIDRGLLHGVLRIRDYNVNTFVEALVRFFGAIALLRWISASASASLGAYVAGFAAAELLIRLSYRANHSGDDDSVDWTEFRRLVIPMAILMLSVAILQNSDMLAVKRWMPAGDAGLYGAASALARGFGVVFVPLYVFSGPILTHAHEERRGVTAEALRLCGWFAATCALPLLVLMFWSRPIITMLYGQAFASAAGLIIPLAGAAIITYLALLAVQVFITLGDFRFLAVYIAAGIVQIALLAVFHQTIGAILVILYVCQGGILLAISVMLYRVRHA